MKRYRLRRRERSPEPKLADPVVLECFKALGQAWLLQNCPPDKILVSKRLVLQHERVAWEKLMRHLMAERFVDD